MESYLHEVLYEVLTELSLYMGYADFLFQLNLLPPPRLQGFD